MDLFMEWRLNNVIISILLLNFTFLLPGYGIQSDIDCLINLKASLQDPLNYLASWNFQNSTEGYICKFPGIECWHENENKILNIRLSDMQLTGEFPRALANCSALTGLDLSSNKLYGTIPADISKILQYVTKLDLSFNNFTGSIPENLSNCSYLNDLFLNNNRFSGQLPPQLGSLGRIKKFSIANNFLTGLVPNIVNATADSYKNNPGLCGGPLPRCRAPRSANAGIIIGIVGGVLIAGIGVSFGMFFYMRRLPKKKPDDPEGNKWAKNIKGAKAIKLSMFEKTVSKMRLSDLMKATNSFSKYHIIASGRTGTMYRATLEDGTSLMVKRLQDTQHSEKEFTSEMTTLGNVKHRNLVPLLGFCITKKERFLVYEHMPNGSLNDRLHLQNNEGNNTLEWLIRLKIGIGAAKGFAFLHHSCNPRILHRNISSKCILLATDFTPKIADFGLARLMNPIDTHLSTFVNGEFGDLGYVAPEYSKTLVATMKGDIYSFGVVLLELVTGEQPTHVVRADDTFRGNLVDWVTENRTKGKLQDTIDKSILGNGNNGEVFQFLKVACNCVQLNPKDRPTMFEVYQLLRAIGEPYNLTTEEEVLMISDVGDTGGIEELIVAR